MYCRSFNNLWLTWCSGVASNSKRGCCGFNFYLNILFLPLVIRQSAMLRSATDNTALSDYRTQHSIFSAYHVISEMSMKHYKKVILSIHISIYISICISIYISI